MAFDWQNFLDRRNIEYVTKGHNASRNHIGINQAIGAAEMKREVWLSVTGYDGYEVSNQGRVRSLDRITSHKRGARRWPGKVLRLIYYKKSPYPAVCLFGQNGAKKFRVHSLVAACFLPPRPSADHEVNHKNGIKTDNRAENLEWLTRAENTQHAVSEGLNPRRTGVSDTKIRQIKSSLGELMGVKSKRASPRPAYYGELTRVAKLHGVSVYTVRAIKNSHLGRHV